MTDILTWQTINNYEVCMLKRVLDILMYISKPNFLL